MNMISVSSSNIAAVGYDSDTSTLYIRFHKSGTYVYSNVPYHIYEGLLNAASHGRYHAAYIKNSYPFHKI